MRLEHILDVLVQKRKIVIVALGVVLLISLGAGYLYQTKLDKEKEASILFDDAWQKVYAVVSDMRSQPNQTYTAGHPNIPQVKKLYEEALNDVDLLTLDYRDTVAGARAALLVQSILPLSNLNILLDNQELIINLSSEEYLDPIKKKHPEFWGATIAIAEGVVAESEFDFATAIVYYEEALNLDKKEYLRDYILIALARNYEMLDNKEKAIEYYQKVETGYPDSVWLSFAMGKQYLLSQSSIVPSGD